MKVELQKEQVVELVKRFNKLNATSHRSSSEAMFDFIRRRTNEYSFVTLAEAIEELRGPTIYEVLSMRNLSDFRAKRLLQATKLTEEPKPAVQDVQQSVSNAYGLIEQAMAKVMVEKFSPEIAKQSMNLLQDFIKAEYGTIQRKVEYKVLEKSVLIDVVHEVLDDVIALSQIGKAVYLSGPSGSGKNIIGSQVSKVLQLPFYFSNAIQQIYQLVGFIDANGRYHETEFHRAFKNGGVFFLDEMDASNPELLIWLNAAIANRYCEFPQGTIQAHENFRIIGAGNTSGKGANSKYVTRQQLDMATLNRFIEVEVNYSKQVEDAIAQDVELAEFIRDYRKTTENIGLNAVTSYREIINIRDLMNVLKWDITKTLKYALTKSMQKDDLRMIIGNLNNRQNKYAKGLEKLC